MTLLAPSAAEIVQAFDDYTRTLTKAEAATFLQRGIPAEALMSDPDGFGSPVALAEIERLDDGRFDFLPGEGEPATIVLARDRGGDITDIIAFQRDQPGIPWIGAAALLGAQTVMDRLDNDALNVLPHPLAWLRAGRRGVVLIDEAVGAQELAGYGPFRAADVEHGLQLRKLLTAPAPEIVFAERMAA